MRETIKRQGYVIRIDNICKERIANNQCPICALPKVEWKRRTDWRCCSPECTQKFERDKIIRSWPELRLKAFERDKYRCVKCGHQPTIEIGMMYSTPENYKERYPLKFLSSGEKDGRKYVIMAHDGGLIGDHIIPIAIGGEEFDINNVQTLCIDCNRIKTRDDHRKIKDWKKGNQTLAEEFK